MSTFESFRDPSGKVILTDLDVWRLVKTDEVSQVMEFLDLDLCHSWQSDRTIVETDLATPEEIEALKTRLNGTADFPFTLFKHRRIEFPSFPYEWSPSMLHVAAALTLDICERLLTAGWGLKDASPFNILFDRSKPVFVDVLSFEKRKDKDPIWLPYNQFVNTFLVPLLVNRELSVPLRNLFLSSRDGLTASEAARLFRGLKKLSSPVRSMVTLPEFLSRRSQTNGNLYKPRMLGSAETARFILQRSFQRLRKQLQKVAPKSTQMSNWTAYTDLNRETIPEYMNAKQKFVISATRLVSPKNVLDVGCNTGYFSFEAAKLGASVVAIDHDEAVIDRVHRGAQEQGLDVLPLVINLSRPTPRLGWRNSENPSFLDRTLGRFDLVLMLAVVHHMLVQERIPLREIFGLAAELTTDALVVEYVPPHDKMFRSLARGRDHLHKGLDEREFVAEASKRFDIVRSEDLPQSDRRIYLMKRKK